MKTKHEKVTVPAKTAELAKKVFRKGNKYVQMRDDLGPIFRSEKWQELFSDKGRPGESPGQLALVLVLQHLENLSDRQVAEQIGARLDWKYLLGLELEAEGIRYQQLSAFRTRLVKGDKSELLLEEILEHLQEKGWLKAHKVQRTDATWISSAGRRLSRLELVWEALSLLLEELAWRAPKWLSQQIDKRWVEMYQRPLGWQRMPQEKKEQAQLALEIGRDGYGLWERFLASGYYEEWYDLPRMNSFRQIWLQQYYQDDEGVHWRLASETPPAALGITTPFDLDARYSRQEHSSGHVGYQLHYTETVTDRQQPQIITDVTTTPATTPDKKVTLAIQTKLRDRQLAPETHLVDAGYISASNLATSRQQNNIHLCGPVPQNSTWQKRADTGYDLSHFQVNWSKQQVTCPEGTRSISWASAKGSAGQAIIRVNFSSRDCQPCPAREQCTKSSARHLTLLPQPESEALAAAREFQASDLFRTAYRPRAGVEALFSHAVNHLDARRSRYRGLAKTHLHHILLAVAINLDRVARWRVGYRRPRPRPNPLTALGLT